MFNLALPMRNSLTLSIHEVAGQNIDNILTGLRPFRDPHHTTSDVAYCEISLHTMGTLSYWVHQPIESHKSILRRFMLIEILALWCKSSAQYQSKKPSVGTTPDVEPIDAKTLLIDSTT